MKQRADFLEGLRVLELGDGVAGASATALLWGLGADVTTVIDLASPHRHGRPQAGSGSSLLAQCLDRGKHVITGAGSIDEVVDEGFDVVLVDRVHGARGLLAAFASIDDHLALVRRHTRPAWVSISAFGLTGPRAGHVATELTIAAASGMLASVRDERTGVPLKLGGQQSLLNSGQAAALAACHAVDLAAAGGAVHLDLSAVEATLAMGPVLEVGGVLLETGSMGGAKRYGAPASFYRCTDGLVRISAMEDHQWQGVVTAMGSPAWAERFATVEARIAAPDEVDDHVAAWTATKSKLDAETELQAHGVPATAVYSPAEILRSPQLEHRQAFEALPLDDGREARVVGVPFRTAVGGNEANPERRKHRSLRGLRVLEASRVLAVPLCGALLGTLGAEVTKLEDLPRLDMYRRRGPYIEAEPGMERSAYFALMNHSKASAGFDVDAERDTLAALLADSDVVIENLGRKRATALGLGASSALDTHPDVLAVSSSGFGQDGPHAEYRAYAYNLQASGALGYLTRTEDGESAEIDIAWADLISAYALATIIAAWAVGPAGNAGAGIDFSMTDLVVAHFNEFLAAASLDPSADESDRANELAPYVVNEVRRTEGGWEAVSVETEGEPELVEPVLDAAALVADAQLAAREFFVSVEHAEWGTRRLVGIPWRQYGEAPLRLGPPPLLAVAPGDQ